jgi:hypothetical protein
MKTIATFWKPEEAHLLKLRLSQQGIEAYIQDENITQLHPWRVIVIGGVRVQVADPDVEAAKTVLSQTEVPPALPDAAGDSGSFACCSCGALIPKDKNRCSACGWSYADGSSSGDREPTGDPDTL